jgi:hypothetical protein
MDVTRITVIAYHCVSTSFLSVVMTIVIDNLYDESSVYVWTDVINNNSNENLTKFKKYFKIILMYEKAILIKLRTH